MEYHKANLFVGRYRTGLFGKVGDHIGLPDAKLRVLRGIEREDGWYEDPSGDYWLVLEHGNFWPVMVRLDEDDIAVLETAFPVNLNVNWTLTTGATTARTWPEVLNERGQTLS